MNNRPGSFAVVSVGSTAPFTKLATSNRFTSKPVAAALAGLRSVPAGQLLGGAAVLAVLSVTAPPAAAGECVLDMGAYLCSGPADPGNDFEQELGDPAEGLDVTTTIDFGLNTAAIGQAGFDMVGTSINFNSLTTQLIETSQIAIDALATGPVTILASGPITSNGTGVNVITESPGEGAVTITLEDDVNSNRGVFVQHGASGDINLTATGNISASGEGVYVTSQNPTSQNIAINTAGVSGYEGGLIIQKTAGVGNIVVTANGPTATMFTTAITVENRDDVDGHMMDLTVTGEVSDPMGRGVYMTDASTSGTMILTVTGDARIDTAGSAISALGGRDLTMTLQGAAQITGDPAIRTIDNDGTIDVAENTVIDGDVSLGMGNDAMTFAGTNMSDISLLDGGAGIDRLTLNGVTGEIAAADIRNWESIEINDIGGLTLTGGLAALDNIGTLTVVENSVLDLSGENTATLDVNIENFGTVTMVDDTPDDQITITGDYTAQSNLNFDAVLDDGSSGSGDTFTILGQALMSHTTVNINQLGGSVGGQTPPEGIPLIFTGGGDGTFALGDSGEIRVGDWVYRLVPDGSGNWSLQSSPFAGGVDGGGDGEPIPTLGVWGVGVLSTLLGWFGWRRRAVRYS